MLLEYIHFVFIDYIAHIPQNIIYLRQTDFLVRYTAFTPGCLISVFLLFFVCSRPAINYFVSVIIYADASNARQTIRLFAA